MGNFSLKEFFKIPAYDNPDELCMGEVEFDEAKCSKCGMCAKICPGSAIAFDSKPYMKSFPENQCMFCGCCSAICPKDAVIMKKPLVAKYFFKPIGHGDIKPPRLFTD
ncbi:MAG TPA: 4Fe-4S binding protein [Desulfomonilia bacterium]|nr:4Fe-4S binding protein [Desulfomonilia bacterium]